MHYLRTADGAATEPTVATVAPRGTATAAAAVVQGSQRQRKTEEAQPERSIGADTGLIICLIDGSVPWDKQKQ